MIPLMFIVILSEMALILVLLFETPLRRPVIMALDLTDRGYGPIMVQMVVGTVILLLASSVYSMLTIHKRCGDEGDVDPTDQVLMSNQLLEATLIGATIFLALMVDRLHHYIRELSLRRKDMEAVNLEVVKREQLFENQKAADLKKVIALEEERITLLSELKQIELKIQTKAKEVNAAITNAIALRKQSEGLFSEYDRLHEENLNLRKQLKTLDWRLSHAGSKKNT